MMFLLQSISLSQFICFNYSVSFFVFRLFANANPNTQAKVVRFGLGTGVLGPSGYHADPLVARIASRFAQGRVYRLSPKAANVGIASAILKNSGHVTIILVHVSLLAPTLPYVINFAFPQVIIP